MRLDSGWTFPVGAMVPHPPPFSLPPACAERYLKRLDYRAPRHVLTLLRTVPKQILTENLLYSYLILNEQELNKKQTGILGRFQSAGPQVDGVEGKEDWGFSRGGWHLFLRWLHASPDDQLVLNMTRLGMIYLPVQ